MSAPAPSHAQLRAFLAVRKAGSLSGAARLLGISQPAVSQAIDTLEAGFGIALFERGARRCLSTAAADRLAPLAQGAVATVADMAEAMAGFRDGGAGRLTIGTGATVCIHLLPGALARLRGALPALEIVVATGNTADILPGVEDGSYDIGIVTLPRRHPTLALSKLRDDELVALLPAGLSDAETPLRPEDLAALPLILFEERGLTRAAIDAWFARGGITPAPRMQLGNVEAIKVLVAAGLGATVLPRLALGDAPEGTVLRPLRPVARRAIGTALRPSRVLDRPLRMLIEALRR